MIRLLLLAWASLFFLVPAAHASDSDVALALLCPKNWKPIARTLRIEAATVGIDSVLLAAIVANESRCRVSADSGKGDYGLAQIRLGGSAAGDATAVELLDPRTNLHLAALHVRRCLELCGDVHGALSVYAGHKKCRPSRYSRRVLGMYEAAMRRIEQERRS